LSPLFHIPRIDFSRSTSLSFLSKKGKNKVT